MLENTSVLGCTVSDLLRKPKKVGGEIITPTQIMAITSNNSMKLYMLVTILCKIITFSLL